MSQQKMLTTVEIQQMLEENTRLIQVISENQNLGKLEECTQYQQRLQQNLVTLAALADAQAAPQQPAAGAAPAQPPR